MRAGRKRTTEESLVRGSRLGAGVRSERERKKLSQQELADRAGIAYATLRRIESGATPNPGVFTVAAIAAALGIPLDHLVRGPGRPRRS